MIVAGRQIRGALERARRRARPASWPTEAIEGGGGDLDAILLDFADRVGEARETTAATAAAATAAGRRAGPARPARRGRRGAARRPARKRRARDAAEFEEAKRNARDDLVALGDDIRALDLDVEMPNADPQARADYDHAVARYTEAEEQWELARRPQDLAPVGAALEEGRWAMASAKARFDGETPPERRPPCFFDPRHGPSSRDVEWSPPYGEQREVPACEADALRVEERRRPAHARGRVARAARALLAGRPGLRAVRRRLLRRLRRRPAARAC